MKFRCISTFDKNKKHYNLTHQKIYDCLYSCGENLFIIDDDGKPYLYDRRNFIKITQFDYLVKSGKNENIC